MKNSIYSEFVKGINVDNFIEKYYSSIDAMAEMSNTQQEPEWHGEGNVLNHTKAVVNCMSSFVNNDDSNKTKILIGSALFHDVGKVFCTIKAEDDNMVERIMSPKHANKGASYLHHKLPIEDGRESIIDLVDRHHQPKTMIEGRINKYSILNLTKYATGEDFYKLCTSDTIGRISNGKELSFEKLDIFRMFCEEYNCFYQNNILDKTIFEEIESDKFDYTFLRTRYGLLNGEIENPIVGKSKYFNKGNFPIVIMMSGLSGSGKTTLASKILKDYDFDMIISPDKIRKDSKKCSRKEAFFSSLRLLKEALGQNKRVIFDATLIMNSSIQKINSLVDKYNGISCLIQMNTLLSECVSNDIKRSLNCVGEKTIQKQARLYEKVRRERTMVNGMEEIKKFINTL